MTSAFPILNFLDRVSNSNVVGPAHISIYSAIVYFYYRQACANPITVYRQQLMTLAKVSGKSTYFKIIRELKDAGIIDYEPSKNPLQGSLIYLLPQ